MLDYLQGKIVNYEDQNVILDVNGLGLKVFLSQNSIKKFRAKHPRLPSSCRILTHLSISENRWEIFGFFDEAEKKAFLLLLGCRGIGPKGALKILNSLTPSDLYAVAEGREDSRAKLQQTPGIGSKNAQRIIAELKNQIDKMEELGFNKQKEGEGGRAYSQTDLFKALQNLGYRSPEIQKAVNQLSANLPQSLTEAIRELLKVMGKR